ncbi:MAG TPA: glycosyltransferase 87 family protein [Ktedonobacteraceae bacterium]|jgi:hypothetical protein
MLDTNNQQMTPATDPLAGARRPAGLRWLLCDVAAILLMGLFLFWGASTQFANGYNDVTRYQCYALAFWQGQPGLEAHGLQAAPTSQCSFLLADSSASLAAKLRQYHLPQMLIDLLARQPSTQPFHALPPEYPLLTLLPFSLPLLAPFAWYQVAFALLMLAGAGLLYVLLLRTQTRGAALAFAGYLALGSWATAAGRFDLLPAGLTLGAVLLAGRARWKWAFALLALATLCKFYPVLLVVPFWLAQQANCRGQKWTSAGRWSASAVFVGLGALVTLVSLGLSVANTLLPLGYFFNRPIQVESFPGTLLWFSSLAGHPTGYNMAYQSLNFVSSLTRYVSPLATVLEIVALAWTFWLQWRGKLDLYAACLLTLLILLATGKVFSPQYLIWVTPLVALVGRAQWRWLLSWGLVCALTTFMFPLHYGSLQEIQQFYAVIAVRNLLLLGMTCTLLVGYIRRQTPRAAGATASGQPAIELAHSRE